MMFSTKNQWLAVNLLAILLKQ